jgi:hypothetical protein
MEVSFFEDEAAWAITHVGRPVAVDGITFFEKREDIVRKLYTRKLYVLEDNTVQVGGTPPRDLLANLPVPSRRGRKPIYSPEEARERRLASRRRSEAKRRQEGKAQATIKAWREANPDKVKAWLKRGHLKEKMNRAVK